MDFPELFGTVIIIECLAAELFAGKVEPAVADNVEAMIIPAGSEDTVYLPAENVLYQKGGNGALPESDILLAPFLSQSWSAGIPAPDMRKNVIELTWIGDTFVLIGNRGRVGSLPAVESVSHVRYCYSAVPSLALSSFTRASASTP